MVSLNLPVPDDPAGSGTPGPTWATMVNQALMDLNAGKAESTDLDAKAPSASPTFTGNPTAPTPAAGDNDTSIATTAFVAAAIAAGGSTLDFASLGMSVNQSYSANNLVPISWDVEVADAAGYHSPTAPTRVTIPAGKGGTFLVVGNMRIAGTNPSSSALSIRKNGSQVVVDTGGSVNGQTYGFSCVGVLALNAGDFIEACVWTVSGSSLSIQWGYGTTPVYQTALQIVRLSA